MNLRAIAAVVAAGAVAACGGPPAPSAWLAIDGVPEADIDVEPAGVVRSATYDAGRLLLGLDAGRIADGVRVRVDGTCPLDVPGGELHAGDVTRSRMSLFVELTPPRTDLGFDVKLAQLRLASTCGEAAITWRQTAGAPPRELSVTEGGRAAAVRTEAVGDRFADVGWGIVPVSPRTRGEVRLEATWHDGRLAAQHGEITLSAASRSRGLPNVAVGASVLLAGRGWKLLRAPPGARASLAAQGSLVAFTPDVVGQWLLADDSARELSLHAGRYDDTPLDCGRSDCHADLAQAAQHSAMTSVFARKLAGAHGPEYPACALGCHTLGEPGLADGGFDALAREARIDPARFASADDLPRELRRLSGVGCMACHGPGAIPEPGARWSVLRSDVCAYCHDAPPRYGQVVAWRSSAMSRSDRDERARTEPACARCHTTAGFLRAEGALADDRPAPPGIGPIGIACAACHAPHAHGANRSGAKLVRAPHVPESLRGATGAISAGGVCIGCHSPDSEGAPFASSAAIWAGVGGLDPATGAALGGSAPHRARGCVSCHSSGPGDVERGAAHGFVARRDGCTTCHAAGGSAPALPPGESQAAAELQRDARQLWARLAPRVGAAVELAAAPHAARGEPPDRKAPIGRAAFDVLLVLEDPGAAAHNLPYARALLHAAQSMLDPKHPAPLEGGRR